MTPNVPSVPIAACPLCHTMSTRLSDESFASGGEWRCATCGQNWTARRLATVAAYAAWVVGEPAVSAGRRLAPRE
jgi:transposase-like protein